MARGKLINTERKARSALTDVVSREYTIHLHTRVHGVGFKHVRSSILPPRCARYDETNMMDWVKQRAPTAVKSVVDFARKAMGTQKVLVDPALNAAIWGKGIKNVPHRIRVRLSSESSNRT